MARVHDLKVWPKYFEAMFRRRKWFEVRHNDRHFKVRDVLLLREWCPTKKDYTGRTLERRVKFKLAGVEAESFGLKPGYCVLGLGMIRVAKPKASLEERESDGLEGIF